MALGYRKDTRQPRKIRYTDAEWSTIVERARAAGRPPARYVRETSLGVVPRAPRGRADAAVIHELGRIGITLNRLASTASGTESGQTAAAIEAALGELLAVVRRLGEGASP